MLFLSQRPHYRTHLAKYLSPARPSSHSTSGSLALSTMWPGDAEIPASVEELSIFFALLLDKKASGMANLPHVLQNEWSR